MGTQISRRSFLKKSAIALGAVAVCKVDGVAGVDQVGGLNTLPGELKEKTMPHVIVKLYPGRSEQQKIRLAEQIVKDVVEIIKCDESSVSVAIEEIKSSDWQKRSISRIFLTTRISFTKNQDIKCDTGRRQAGSWLCCRVPGKVHENEAWERMVKPDVKYRFAIDMASLKAE